MRRACGASNATLMLLHLMLAALAGSMVVPALPRPPRPLPAEPWGLRLALTEREGEMRVLWNTEQPTAESCVQLILEDQDSGRSGMLVDVASSISSAITIVRRRLAAADALGVANGRAVICGSSRALWEPSTNASAGAVHNVLLSGLHPGRRYAYRVGSDPEAAWSAWWAFRARRAPVQFTPSAPLRLLLAGDLGVANARCLPALVEEAAAGDHDAFLLVRQDPGQSCCHRRRRHCPPHSAACALRDAWAHPFAAAHAPGGRPGLRPGRPRRPPRLAVLGGSAALGRTPALPGAARQP